MALVQDGPNAAGMSQTTAPERRIVTNPPSFLFRTSKKTRARNCQISEPDGIILRPVSTGASDDRIENPYQTKKESEDVKE